MKQAVLFVTLVFLSTLVVMGWINGGFLGRGADHVLGTRSSFWSRWFGRMRQPKTLPTRGLPTPTPSIGEGEIGNVSDDPEIDLSNLEQELGSLDQEMNALKLDAGVQ